MVKLHFLYMSRKGSAIGLARGRNLFFCQLVIFFDGRVAAYASCPRNMGKDEGGR